MQDRLFYFISLGFTKYALTTNIGEKFAYERYFRLLKQDKSIRIQTVFTEYLIFFPAGDNAQTFKTPFSFESRMSESEYPCQSTASIARKIEKDTQCRKSSGK